MRAPRFRSLSLLSAAFFLFTSPAWAVCEPKSPPVGQTSCMTGADTTCSMLGRSTLDADGLNIIFCLKTSKADSTLRWKSMGTATISTGYYSVPFATLATYQAGCENRNDWDPKVDAMCIMACNKWCHNDPSVTEKNYSGGTILEWNFGDSLGGCQCI